MASSGKKVAVVLANYDVALVICLFAMLIYIPLGYLFDSWMYKRFNKPKG